MALPGNGIFVVRGEISTLMMAIKRGNRWSTPTYQEDEQDGLMKKFIDLKSLLISVEDLRPIDPNMFLAPFLEVIRSEETTGQITSLALSAIDKFLSYGLIDPTHSAIAVTVENIADAVTHARFVGSDQASDGVVLMKIVKVLRTLMLSPEGSALTNESVCEVMLSCFRICFEPRLNELLRRTAEHALKDIILLLFMRLPQFAEEQHTAGLIKKLKMMASGGFDQTNKRKRSTKGSNKNSSETGKSTNNSQNTVPTIYTDSPSDTPSVAEGNPSTPNQNQLLVAPKIGVLATTPSTPLNGNIVDMQGKFMQTPQASASETISDIVEKDVESSIIVDQYEGELVPTKNEIDSLINNETLHGENNSADTNPQESIENTTQDPNIPSAKGEDFVNSMGVRFTPQSETETSANIALIPYGMPCIRELLRFLISLCNPLDKQNTDAMIHVGLSLLTIALEVGADSIGKHDTLLQMVKDDMCKNLFALLNSERLTIFAADLQVCFLLFESQRICLKFHLEYYLNKLAEIIGNENPRTPYEMRELALDNLLQFLRIPSFSAELYINYDCNLYCTNLLEDLVKLLSKNALSVTQAIYTIHQLSLDGLLTIITDIEKNCLKVNKAIGTIDITRHSRSNSNADKSILESNDPNTTANSSDETSAVENIRNFILDNIHADDEFFLRQHDKEAEQVTHEQLLEIKNKKRILTQGTELFNQRPDKGIQFLQENNYLNSQLDPLEVAHFLRENSGLDKKMIGEYISKKKNVESKILETFVKSFNFANMRIDLALRQYLETFRLPGEAPLIFLVMEHFAEHWHQCNNEPFANTDAAFRLAYAIIMLNMDQHNYNAKRLNVPMRAEDFQKNLRGLNGSADFDQDMLVAIFNGIKNEEIIMPAEQTGLVRENYLWKVLLRRNQTKDGRYVKVKGNVLDKDIFQLVWGPTLAALSFMFDRSTDKSYSKSLIAFTKGATISAHFMLHDDFNALILTLCKFTTLLNITADDGNVSGVIASNAVNDITTSVQFGLNIKAQLAMKNVFGIVHKHGDCLRCDGWKNIIEVILQLFKLKLLPKCLMEVEDFCELNGKVTLTLEKPIQKQEIGLFSSLYSYLSSDSQRQPTYEEQEIIKVAKRCVKECQLDQIVAESKFLHFDALRELIQCLLEWLKPPNHHKSVGIPYAEDTTVFLMEFLVKILVQNRDRLLSLWNDCRDQIYLLLLGSSSCGYNYLLIRTTIALLKLAIYLMRNEELCPVVLQSLKMIIMLKPSIILKISKQISTGMYELLKTSAQNIHTEGDWDIIFTLLECVGAGAVPPDFEDTLATNQLINQGAKSEGALSSGDEETMSGLNRGYISDSEIPVRLNSEGTTVSSSTNIKGTSAENWIIVNKDSDVTITSRPTSPVHSLAYPCKLLSHSTFALVKCWDCLTFIVRNVAHITPYNFESCVKCIRTFVEAALHGRNNYADKRNVWNKQNNKASLHSSRSNKKEVSNPASQHKSSNETWRSTGEHYYDENNDVDNCCDEEIFQRYETIAIQLLDLMHTLHTRTAQIFRWWAEEGGALPQCSQLWALGWCPLLQGIARLATDQRRQVRTSAVTCLQRALLVHDLQTLTGPEWESCFKQVLFPLLYDLLAEVPNPNSGVDAALLEESRMRTATIMSKVFLHHLTPLIALSTFNELWLDILDYIEKFLNVGSDMLHEAMLESLKNMLLVMNSVRIFHNNDGVTYSPLWDLTWNRINQFLPHLKEELFNKEPLHNSRSQPSNLSTPAIQSRFEESKITTAPNLTHVATAPQLSERIQQKLPEPSKPLSDHNSSLQTTSILNPPGNTFIAPVLIGSQGTVPVSTQVATIPSLNTNLLFSQIQTSIQSSLLTSSYPVHESNTYAIVEGNPILLPINDDKHINTIITNSSVSSTLIETLSTITSSVTTTSEPIPHHQPIQNASLLKYSGSSSTQPISDTETNRTSYLNSIFSNIIELPVTPSPPPLLEADENFENDTDTNATIKKDEPRVPISHLTTGNQYPSLSKIPPANIAQSFPPIYVEPQNYQQVRHQRTVPTEELYNEYVNNPYNLTLDVDQSLYHTDATNSLQSVPKQNLHAGLDTSIEQSPQNQQAQQSNIFQSANYFGTTDDNIPPGSEMLFGNP